MSYFSRKIRISLVILLSLLVISGLVAGGVYSYLSSTLPSTANLKEVQLQVPLRIYTRDGKLMGEFGEMKRTPLKFTEVPDLMVKAVLAAEDDRYFSHPGVDYQGLLRAVWYLMTTGEKAQGGSTITMQVARNFFLSSEKTYTRKLSEILLALKINRELTKEEILELYLNKIYLGNRAYGIAAAAQVYYGAELKELSVAQIAMIAGLPKAPSRFNPIVAPDRALERRNYVLRRMHELNHIDNEVFQAGLAELDKAALHALDIEVEAPFIAEMVRNSAVELYGEDAYSTGLKVYTTLDSRLQDAANAALRNGLVDYEMRHGYRGPVQHVKLSTPPSIGADGGVDEQEWRDALKKINIIGGLLPALVIGKKDQILSAVLVGGEKISIVADSGTWALPEGSPVQTPNAVAALKVGDIIRVQSLPGKQWRLAQVPKVEGALVALRPDDGALISLAGGFAFGQSKFNRVTQAVRQPGSSFKPFIYAAGLERGYTPATLINDAPLVFGDVADTADSEAWRPQNFTGEFLGPTRLREALVFSRNLVSIRLLQAIDIDYALAYAERFGFQTKTWPKNLSLALGSVSVTPLEVAKAYSVFANGGYQVQPYYIERIEDAHGAVLMQAKPAKVCPACVVEPIVNQVQDSATQITQGTSSAIAVEAANAVRVISPQNAYLMTSMMRDVVRRGTAKRAMQLGRQDLAGKTGTTNDQRDAWFAGYNDSVVAVSWVGFDTPRSLWPQETGGYAALPIWINFMAVALKDVPERTLEQPEGLVSVRINPETGLLAGTGAPNAIFEIFPENAVPGKESDTPPAVIDGPSSATGATEAPAVPEQLF